MTKFKSFRGARCRRMLWIVGFLAVVCNFGSAWADDTRLEDSVKKVGNNFGELLKGMGQEVKKAGGSLVKPDKKDKRKKTESADKELDKGQEKSR